MFRLQGAAHTLHPQQNVQESDGWLWMTSLFRPRGRIFYKKYYHLKVWEYSRFPTRLISTGESYFLQF